MPDDELIRLHDKAAAHTSVGISYYLEELRRRDMERSAAASKKLARASFWLTLANTFLALAAVIVAIWIH